MTTSPNDYAAILTLPSAEVALAGVNTPLGGIFLTGPETADVAVIITASGGALFAGSFPGAIVSGGGTSSLWIAGSPSQVNAKLATLVYAAAKAGSGTLSFRLIDPSSATPGPVAVPVHVVPLVTPPGAYPPTLTVSGGTLTLDSHEIDGLALDIHDAQTGAGAATLLLIDSTLGADTRLDVASSNATAAAPRIAIARAVELAGHTDFEAGPALVTIAQNSVLTNTGDIAFVASSARISGPGTLQNDGVIEISAAGAGPNPAIDVAVTGAGVISLAASSRLCLGDAVSSSQTVRFEDGSGFLDLGAPQTMQATVVGFVPGDQIQLGELQIDAAAYTQTATGGTLALYDGAQRSASLNFGGSYHLSDFVLSVMTDSAGDGGAITTLTVRASSSIAADDASTIADVYRFFDTKTGTQFLTQDPSECDSIIASQPTLEYEGIAMRALDSRADDPAALPVFRFFDTTDGTHFLTASTAERDTLLASRPDLVLEPTSTIWEDATQRPGDVPVFRFFDSGTGTHFYTSDIAERASILATRPDFTAEGIAFYAPGE